MAERKKGISHDTAAQLLGIAPGDLEALVRTGKVRRNDRNDYAVQILVQDYVAHVRAESSGSEAAPSQAEIAAHLGVSDRLVRELLTKWDLDHKQSTMSEIRLRYIDGLREVAAGRATNGEVELATERALLAREQRIKIEMQNAVTRKELAPAALLTDILSRVGVRCGRILEALPGKLRRLNDKLSASDLRAIETEIAKCRNQCAAISLDDIDLPEDDEPIDEEGAE